jgi:hypothetical protein
MLLVLETLGNLPLRKIALRLENSFESVIPSFT